MRPTILCVAGLLLCGCATEVPIEGDEGHVTVSLAGNAGVVAAEHCRMFGKHEQFRNMDNSRQIATFNCVSLDTPY